MTFPCAACGAPIFDHQPILNPDPDGPLYLRGAGISDPGGWAVSDDTGEQAYIQPFASDCPQYIPETEPAP